MQKRMPALDSLRVLAVCVRHGNFSRAAFELGITPTAVSQRVRALEAQIGVELFRRSGPRLITTDRAKALAQRLDQALSLMRSAVDDCRRVKHPLRVTCAPTFAARWLLPRLAAYHSMPGADPLVLDNSKAVLEEGAFDVAIRSGIGPWPGCGGIKLVADQGTPMLSPKWLPDTGRFTVQRLLKVPLIPDPRWPDWFELAGFPNASPQFIATRFPNYELEAQAAAQGLGAALISPVLFAGLREQNVLIAPFPWRVEGPGSYWLLWTNEAAASHFVGWMKSQFGSG